MCTNALDDDEDVDDVDDENKITNKNSCKKISQERHTHTYIHTHTFIYAACRDNSRGKRNIQQLATLYATSATTQLDFD